MQNSLTADGQKEDFSDLPPNQQRKKLQAKIAELQHKVDQETNTRDGLMKMKIVYEANSSLGNPMTVEGQLNESEHELEKLKNDLKKYQGFLDKANQQQVVNNSPQSNRNVPNGHRTSRWVQQQEERRNVPNLMYLTCFALQTFQWQRQRWRSSWGRWSARRCWQLKQVRFRG